MLYIWDPPVRKLPKIRLRSFLYEGTISQKNKPEVSYKVVSKLRVLTVAIFIMMILIDKDFNFNIHFIDAGSGGYPNLH